jgi:hypothetical protein
MASERAVEAVCGFDSDGGCFLNGVEQAQVHNLPIDGDMRQPFLRPL